MKTYLTVMFNSEGARPTEVAEKLYGLGFTAIKGTYDFEYNWGRTANVRDVLWFGDKVHAALKGYKVLFKLETIR